MARETPQFRMADRLAKGTLADELRAFKAEGASYSLVVRELYARHGIEVTAPTIGSWFKLVEDDEPQAVGQ